jgi:phospholipid N-methyltransferase
MSLRTFTSEAVASFQTTAAVVPSSRYLTRAMLAPLPLARARTVVEFGPGTGTITQALLAMLPPAATLYAFEVNPRFCDYLRRHLPDPRLVVIPTSAMHIEEELRRRGVECVDACLSSLGLTLMPDAKRHRVLRGIVPFFGPESVLTQYQYVHGLLLYFQKQNGHLIRFSAGRLLRSYFREVETEVIWRNVPPAIVFACRR